MSNISSKTTRFSHKISHTKHQPNKPQKQQFFRHKYIYFNQKNDKYGTMKNNKICHNKTINLSAQRQQKTSDKSPVFCVRILTIKFLGNRSTKLFLNLEFFVYILYLCIVQTLFHPNFVLHMYPQQNHFL